MTWSPVALWKQVGAQEEQVATSNVTVQSMCPPEC